MRILYAKRKYHWETISVVTMLTKELFANIKVEWDSKDKVYQISYEDKEDTPIVEATSTTMEEENLDELMGMCYG